MNFKIILVILSILAMVFVSSCSYDDEEVNKVTEDNIKLNKRLNERQNENKVIVEDNNKLNKELIELQDKNTEEVESLKETIDELNKEIVKMKEEVSIYEDKKKLIDFFDKFSTTNIYHGMADTNVKVKVNLEEPLRSFPDDNAPYIKRYDGLSYSKANHEIKIVECELLYSTIDAKGKEWCLIIADGEIGYVEEVNILEYTERFHNYDPPEQFKDLRIGMTVGDVYSLFGEKVQFYYPRLRYFRMLGVYDEYDIDGIKHTDEIVSFFYNPNTRIVDFIRVSSMEYELESGFKVRDSLSDVFGYYDLLYTEVEDMPFDFGDEHRLYDIGDGYWLELQGRDGLLIEIIITPGYSIYT